jgi:hypothetical protein
MMKDIMMSAIVPNNWLAIEESVCATGRISRGKMTRLTRFACETIFSDEACTAS